MKIHNSLTGKVDTFTPTDSGEVKIYTCGPTVYDHVHIGNLRTYVFEDTLRRVFKAQDIKVNHVLNITDVDDKTIKRSKERYPDDESHEALKKLTSHFEKIFLEDAAKLNIDLADSKIVRATDHIAEMQGLIKKIGNKYIGEDGIYFDITKDPDYGVLAKLDRSHAHHRINNDEYDKEHVADFALWKKEGPNEPTWEFEIDGQNISGRPGWHIECSAMSVMYLGQPFDIHTGGVDLKFPHHENEIAQTRSASGDSLANYFMHAEHLLVDGHKMSKKLKNFYTLANVIKKGYDPLALRLLFLQAHYRSQLNFTWESLEAAAANLKTLQSWADLIHQSPVSEDTQTVISDINESLANDINTSEAMATLNDYVGQSLPSVDVLNFLDAVFGLELGNRGDITAKQKEIINKRQLARQKNDWNESDNLRDLLKAQGLELKDTDNGPVWSRL